MDKFVGKNSEEILCRTCMKDDVPEEQLQSLFEFTNDEMELYKILMLLAPITICRNDGNFTLWKLLFYFMFFEVLFNILHFRILSEDLHRVQKPGHERLSLPTNVC